LDESISHDDRSSAKSSSVSKPSAAAPPVKQKKPKPTWKAVVDPHSGRTYYYHRKTRKTTWRKPEELKKLEAELNSAASDNTPTQKNGDAGASTPSRDKPNASCGDSPLLSEGQEAWYKTPERATKSDSKQETARESPIKPSLVIDANTTTATPKLHKAKVFPLVYNDLDESTVGTAESEALLYQHEVQGRCDPVWSDLVFVPVPSTHYAPNLKTKSQISN
jgi:hypothetical protein